MELILKQQDILENISEKKVVNEFVEKATNTLLDEWTKITDGDQP